MVMELNDYLDEDEKKKQRFDFLLMRAQKEFVSDSSTQIQSVFQKMKQAN